MLKTCPLPVVDPLCCAPASCGSELFPPVQQQVCLKTLINLSCPTGLSDVKMDELNDAALQARKAVLQTSGVCWIVEEGVGGWGGAEVYGDVLFARSRSASQMFVERPHHQPFETDVPLRFFSGKF